ncbi:putative toxin-antitoxin system toxin component, PIN family [Algoriphagus sp. A40]|uniref:putative toxin-antitoxin system toxin component, PIN family n=1 Tax=Algoriphagus sp. A40 TaxID=1945863 RepID=UPI0009852E59|nr:putative toxin-antitoxin system toxin component, PIN family [Algoriphagus sp. A40]
MKVILDTNILVSALISKGYPSIILERVIESENMEICLSNLVFEEYKAVLARPKFSRFPAFSENVTMVLHFLKNHALNFEPIEKVELLQDKSDNKFLELCLESKADYLITGNSQDFKFPSFRNTKILPPKEFVELILKSKY